MKQARKLIALNLALFLILSQLPLQAFAESITLTLGSIISFEEPSEDDEYMFTPTSSGFYTSTVSRSMKYSNNSSITPASCGSLTVYQGSGIDVPGIEYNGLNKSVYSYTAPMDANKTYTIVPTGGGPYMNQDTSKYDLSVTKTNIQTLNAGQSAQFNVSYNVASYNDNYRWYDPHYFEFKPVQSGWYTFALNSSSQTDYVGWARVYDSAFDIKESSSVYINDGISLYLQSGSAYYFSFEPTEYDDATGSYSIKVSQSNFPAITTSASQTVFTNRSLTYVTFTPEISGTYTITALGSSDGYGLNEMSIYSSVGDWLDGTWEKDALSALSVTMDMAGGITYYIGVDGNSTVSVAYGGKSDTAIITELSPENGAANIDYSGTFRFAITFDREIASTDGRANLSGDGAFTIIRVSDGKVVYRATKSSQEYFEVDFRVPKQVIIYPGFDGAVLEPRTQYYITMDEGLLQFVDGSVSPAITSTDWRFTTVAAPVFSTTNSVTIKTGDKKTLTAPVSVKWDDGWFVNDATIYNHELARTSMALSGAAYVEKQGKPWYDSITDALEAFGFDKIEPNNYDYNLSKSNNDVVAYTFAVKELKNIAYDPTYLVAIVIKGTSGNEEWYSNFNIQTGNTHSGFNQASSNLIASLSGYLSNVPNDANIKFLITGHSRGAAVANLVAAKITDSALTTRNNVYGYTFATPTVSTQAKEAGYENIFNIISGEDFVTQIPLGQWKYKHYGIDLLLPSKSYYKNGYSTVSSKMAATYKRLVNKDFNFYESGTQKVDYLVSDVYSLAPTVKAFYSDKHDLRGYYLGSLSETTTSSEYFGILADFLVPTWWKGIDNYIDLGNLLLTLGGDYGSITAFFVINGKDIGWEFQDRIFCAHMMATYYSWLESCTATELFGNLNERTRETFKRIKIACPVDVYIYDENEGLVASVVNETIDKNILAVGIADGVKTIDLPNDQNYTIKIVATDGGTVDYTVQELSAEAIGNSVLRTVTFNPIDIVDGDRLTGYINDILYTNADNYSLTKNDVNTIRPDSDTLNQSPSTPSTPNTPTGGDNSSNDSYDNDPTYSITIPSRVTGGTVKVTPTSASERQRVTITVKSNSGYELDILTVTDSKGNTLTLTDQGNGKYTFIMPKSKVSIDVSFKAITHATQVAPINFTDVQSSAYYYDAVAWAVENGIAYGITDTTFGPELTCTRAQIVSFMWRQAGAPTMSGTNPFTDVSSSDYYYDAVLWAVENGITAGTGDGTTFSPSESCTRAQAMTFLYRDKGSPAANGTNSFTDISASAYYANAVQWAVANSVTYGITDTFFGPDQNCTRAQIMSFMYRARAN